MDDGALLLRAICADPADDVRRLAFADWCDENGRPRRAEFIRLQVALENTPFIKNGGANAIWPEPWASRIRRADELAEAGGAEWAGAARRLKPQLPAHMFRSWYSRGFVESIPLDRDEWDVFQADADAIFAELPVTRVTGFGMPYRAEVARGNWFWRGGGMARFDSASLPTAVYELLPEENRELGWRYSSDATHALSAALVAFGRHAADLPPLNLNPVGAK